MLLIGSGNLEVRLIVSTQNSIEEVGLRCPKHPVGLKHITFSGKREGRAGIFVTTQLTGVCCTNCVRSQ